MNFRLIRYAIAAISFLPAAVIAADSFRCGTHVISEGLPKRKVLQYCGQPTEKRDNDMTWVYDWGPERRVMIVKFDPDGNANIINSE